VREANDIEVYRDWKQSAIFLKMAQLQNRRSIAKKGLDQYQKRKFKQVEFRRMVTDGYDRFGHDEDYKEEQKQMNTKYVQKKDIPPPLTKKELAMKKEVEDKVRLLLQRTELKGIASSAKVVVSIANKVSTD
jgi:hypothetical protein